MTGHGVRLTPDRKLAVHRCAPPEDPARLRRTIDALRASAGAGAVDIVQVTDGDDRVELVVAFAGRVPTAPMRADELAPVAAALAGHLSDLHLRGLAHGALRPEHVLVDAEGGVRLCGFGDADGAEPAADVKAFGTLLCDLLDDDDRSDAADTLRFHAERCQMDAAVRPTMAAIAASLANSNGRARAIATRGTTSVAPRRWPIAVAATATVVLAIIVAAQTRGVRDDERPAAAPTMTVTPTTVARTTTSVTAPVRVWPSALHGNGSSWELGDADDRTILGDWDGDGVATPALVQRPSGAVFVVDRWPSEIEVAARYVTTVSSVIDVSVERGQRGDLLVVVTDGGVRIRVALSA